VLSRNYKELLVLLRLVYFGTLIMSSVNFYYLTLKLLLVKKSSVNLDLCRKLGIFEVC